MNERSSVGLKMRCARQCTVLLILAVCSSCRDSERPSSRSSHTGDVASSCAAPDGSLVGNISVLGQKVGRLEQRVADLKSRADSLNSQIDDRTHEGKTLRIYAIVALFIAGCGLIVSIVFAVLGHCRASMICTNADCRRANDPGSVYCARCGIRLKRE